MTLLAATVVSLVVLAPLRVHSQTIKITRIAIQEQRDGKAADWMEKVSDEQYRAGSSAE